jgi:hypothetical protein
MRNYNPYYAELHECKGKSCYVPINPTYRELLRAVDCLGLKTKEDEKTLRRTGKLISRLPESLAMTDRVFICKFESGEIRDLALDADKALGSLSDERANAVINLLVRFNLPHDSLFTLLDYIKSEKKKDEIYDYDNAVIYRGSD